MKQRIRPLLLSVLFLLISVGTYEMGVNYLFPQAPTTTLDSPVGTWQQYVMDGDKPIYLATFTFVKENDDYKVVADHVAPVTFPQSDFRTFAHIYDGQRWGFHSDWHEYGVAWFELQKVDDGRFEGYAYLDGERRPNRHILIRVE
tara:strand:+ start:285 stop:719 length:435 start_codon:yes stop_codon:yes gene_type:complete